MSLGILKKNLLIFLMHRINELIRRNCIYEFLSRTVSISRTFDRFAFRNRATPEYFPFSISNKVNFAMAQQCACIRVVLVGTRTLGTRNSSTSARRSCCCTALFSPWEQIIEVGSGIRSSRIIIRVRTSITRIPQVSPVCDYLLCIFV